MKKFTRSLLALLLVVAMVLPNLVGIANAAPLQEDTDGTLISDIWTNSKGWYENRIKIAGDSGYDTYKSQPFTVSSAGTVRIGANWWYDTASGIDLSTCTLYKSDGTLVRSLTPGTTPTGEDSMTCVSGVTAKDGHTSNTSATGWWSFNFANIPAGDYYVTVLATSANINFSLTAYWNASSTDDDTTGTDRTGVTPVVGVKMDTKYIVDSRSVDEDHWFFNASGENSTFGREITVDSEKRGLDTYNNDLAVNRSEWNNGLTLRSSTDGGIFNLPNYYLRVNTDNKNYQGVLSIDWESGEYSKISAGSSQIFGDGYTDGTYTIVGWGGSFDKDNAKNEINIRMKDDNDGTLDEALKHMTIYLVNDAGKITNKIYWDGTQNTDRLYETEEGANYSESANNGYKLYKAILSTGNGNAEGIKIAFDRSSTSGARHTGTLLISGISLRSGESNWTDALSPFEYTSNKTNLVYDRTDNQYLPFIRLESNDNGIAVDTTSGSNITPGNPQTHYWTMSTSDANIVKGEYQDEYKQAEGIAQSMDSINMTSTIDALQIKYRHDSKTTGREAEHTTYAELIGSKDLNAHWLVMTLGTAQLDNDILDMNVKLLDVSGNERASIPLSEFVTSNDGEGTKLSAEGAQYLAGTYRTVYYDLTQLQGFEGFRSIRFYFDNVEDTISSGIREARYMYLTQVYLLGEGPSIRKSVDKTTVSAGDTLTYTVSVSNHGKQSINSYVVTDQLPEGVEFVSCTGDGVYADGCITWTISADNSDYAPLLFDAPAKEFQVVVKVKSGTQQILNQAQFTEVNGAEYSLLSNEVESRVADFSSVFYAEANQQTTLNFPEGQVYVLVDAEKQDTLFTGKSLTSYSGWWGTNEELTASGHYKGNVTFTISLKNSESGNVGADIGSLTLTGKNGNTYTISLTGTAGTAQTLNGGVTGSFTTNATVSDGHTAQTGPDANGPQSNTYVSYSFVGLPEDDYTVKVTVATAWANVKFTLDATYTGSEWQQKNWTSVSFDDEAEKSEDVTVTAGENNRQLKYTSTNPGIKSFGVKYTVEGTEYPGRVTVYTYQVKDHLYVLDFGLSVNLTGTASDGVQTINDYAGILNSSVTSVGADTVFKGIIAQSDKKNNNNVADAEDYYNGTEYGATSGSVTKAGYNGKVIIQPNTAYQFTYKPTSFLDSADVFYYGVQVSVNGQSTLDSTNATPVMEGKITVIPATSVYYEDNFASSGTGANGDNGIIYSSFTKVYSNETVKNNEGSENDTTSANRTQSNSLNLNYGYDDAYATDDQFSGETATELQGGAYALFEFWGTGFDIISHTATDTGTVHVYVYSGDEVVINGTKLKTNPQNTTLQGNPKPVASMSVNTYYENNGTEGLYQIPVISKTDLTYGKYVVKIAVSTNTNRAVEIDGIRIYNPAGFKIAGEGEEKTPYDLYTDSTNSVPNETDLEYQEIRALVLGTSAEWKHTVKEDADEDGKDEIVVEYEVDNNYKASLLDCKADTGEYTLQNGLTIVEYFTEAYNPSGDAATSTSNLLDYASSGPNNELYLGEGYAVAFAVQGDNLNQNVLQIGAKAVKGSPTIEYLNSKGEWTTLKTLSTATEMYYELNLIDCYTCNSQRVVVLRVAADSANDDVVSLTKVKIPETLEIVAPSDKIVVTVANADA